jgi:hypothetical protein
VRPEGSFSQAGKRSLRPRHPQWEKIRWASVPQIAIGILCVPQYNLDKLISLGKRARGSIFELFPQIEFCDANIPFGTINRSVSGEPFLSEQFDEIISDFFEMNGKSHRFFRSISSALTERLSLEKK